MKVSKNEALLIDIILNDFFNNTNRGIEIITDAGLNKLLNLKLRIAKETLNIELMPTDRKIYKNSILENFKKNTDPKTELKESKIKYV